MFLQPADFGSQREGGERIARTQRLAKMLIDIRVDGQHRPTQVSKVSGEQSGERGLTTAPLTYKRDPHGCAYPSSETMRQRQRQRQRQKKMIVILTNR
jgi:hypothetical protein